MNVSEFFSPALMVVQIPIQTIDGLLDSHKPSLDVSRKNPPEADVWFIESPKY